MEESFPKTRTALHKTLNFLLCNKCSKLPDGDVWILSNCKHKYCSTCFKGLQSSVGKSKKCITCHQLSPSINCTRPDLFSTALLSQLRLLDKHLVGCLMDDSVAAPVNEMEKSSREEEEDEIPILTNYSSAAHDQCDKNAIEWKNVNDENIDNGEMDIETQDGQINDAFDALSSEDLFLSSEGVAADANVAHETDLINNPLGSMDGDESEMGTNKLTTGRRFFKESRQEKPKLRISPFEMVERKKAPITYKSRKMVNSIPPTSNSKASFPISSNKGKIETRSEILRKENERVTVTSGKNINITLKSNSVHINSPASVMKKNSKGETALHVAARAGQEEKVKKLLQMSADINAQDFAGWTPLHEAVNSKMESAIKVIEMLLENGCLVNVAGGYGETALHEAARFGNIQMVKLLLAHGASGNIPNDAGLLPRQVTVNKEISVLILNYKGPYKRKLYDINNTAASILCLKEKEKKTIVFFACPVKQDLLEKAVNVFQLKVVETLTNDVTHVIFDCKRRCNFPPNRNYLLGILSGAWLMSSDWLVDSISQNILLNPLIYEIGIEESSDAQKRSRLNRELKKPGLFHGLSFYIYKNSGFVDKNLKLNKKDLSTCIRMGDGEVLIREPNPDAVDPLDNPVRFHAKDPTHKLVFTSHVILFGEKNEPPKHHNLEHVKTLRVDWFIQSILTFRLSDTDSFVLAKG